MSWNVLVSDKRHSGKLAEFQWWEESVNLQSFTTALSKVSGGRLLHMGRWGNGQVMLHHVQLAYLSANRQSTCREPDSGEKMEEYFNGSSLTCCTRVKHCSRSTRRTPDLCRGQQHPDGFAPTLCFAVTPCSGMQNAFNSHEKCWIKDISGAQVLH